MPPAAKSYDVEGPNAFGSRQLGNEVAEGGHSASIDATVQVILPKDRHHFGLTACSAIVGQKELLHHGLAPDGRGEAIVALTAGSLDFDFQGPHHLLAKRNAAAGGVLDSTHAGGELSSFGARERL